MGNFNKAQIAVESALLTGLKSVTKQQSVFFSAEWDSGIIATGQATFGGAMTLNGVYHWGGDVNTDGRRAYAHIPVEPAFLLEEPYDEEGPDGNKINPKRNPTGAALPMVGLALHYRRLHFGQWLRLAISCNGLVRPTAAFSCPQLARPFGYAGFPRHGAAECLHSFYHLV